MPSIIGRLAGTAARIEELITSVNTALLELKSEGKWSIKEEIGHLVDMEPLWFGRVEDVINNELELRMAEHDDHHLAAIRNILLNVESLF